MPDLVEFITARLEEDEAVARDAGAGHDGNHDGVWDYSEEWGRVNTSFSDLYSNYDDAEHIARHDPARVLREVSAKRAILARHTKSVGDDGYADFCDECDGEFPCGTLRALVTAYSDHPNYRAEWTIGA